MYRIPKKETNQGKVQEVGREVAVEAAAMSVIVRDIVAMSVITSRMTARETESAIDQDRGTPIATSHQRRKANGVNEEVSLVLQVIGVPTSTEAIGEKAESVDQDPGLTRDRNLE